MLQRIRQEHDSGCFIAAVATLLQVPYVEAFSRLYPGTIMPPVTDYSARVGRLIEESLALLPRVGIQLHQSKLRSVRSLKKRTALIILRWKYEPHLSHAVVFDGEQGKILDPCYESPLSHSIYNRNLEAIYYVKRTQPYAQQQLPVRSPDPIRTQDSGGLSLRSGLPSSQAPNGNAHWGCPGCAWESYGDW